LKNYYLWPDAQHKGDDTGLTTPYRKMKWESLKNASVVLSRRFDYLRETGDFYLAPPAMK
jgi:hypothetical protein